MPGETPFDGYDRSHISNQAAYARKIDRLYREVIREVALYAISLKAVFKGNKPLSFTDYPSVNRKVDNLVKGLYDGLMLVVVNGIRSEYTLANNRCNELCRMVYGDKNGKLTKEQERKYYKNGDKAAEAFAKRKDNGMGLSDRVWKLVEPYKSELEAGVDIGLRRGRSADELSRDLRSYLKDPHKLFRRVRDEHGQLQLSKNAKAYHPGRGVYRSSYRNARRLTATETNMAYRTAEYERWQKMDFVVGIRIETSQTNHPAADICDTLAGDYPKNFKWVGWHPHCRCIQTPIIRKSDLLADEGETVQEEKAVKKLPPQFEKWMDENRERIVHAKSVPYFIWDNKKIIEKTWKTEIEITKSLSIAERAKIRQEARTQEQADAIRKRWVERRERRELEASPLFSCLSLMEEFGVELRDVQKLQTKLSETEIISRLGGLDMTEGSCASLALAYAGIKAGYNVTDYRGGFSQSVIARNTSTLISEAGGRLEIGRKSYIEALEQRLEELLSEGAGKQGKEFILGVGRHAAVIRPHGKEWEYLELQDAKERNGFKKLTKKALKERFKVSMYTCPPHLIGIEELVGEKGFTKLLGYINTAEASQMKGAGGMMK